MKKIAIYKGEGASGRCIRSLLFCLKDEIALEPFKLSLIDKETLLHDEWIDSTSLLIFPGGRDTPYHLDLQGKANRHISTFVNEGGKFLGICAGGYYGSSSIEFERGNPLEVVGERELRFFPGIAKGPAYGNGKFCYDSQEGARIASLSFQNSPSAAYYNGGCFFHQAESYPGTEIIATYSEIEGNLASIIQCQVGRGCAILSGVHPEYSSHHPHLKDLPPLLFFELEKIETQRKKLFIEIFERVLS